MATAAKSKQHFFVVNQLGQSADRRGPFESAEAAAEWAEKNYAYPAWVVPAVPVMIVLVTVPLTMVVVDVAVVVTVPVEPPPTFPPDEAAINWICQLPEPLA